MFNRNIIASAVLLALPGLAVAENWTDNVQMSGLLEVEATFGDDANEAEDDTVDNSDVTLATVELGIDAQINDRVSASILLLHEEDDTPLELDEGVITVNLNDDGSFYFAGGQMYVPFGNFETHMVSDPLTLELGETRQSVLQFGFENNGFSGSVYVYKGDVVEASAEDDTVESFGVNIGYVMETDSFGLDIGASYISNIADSFGFMDSLPSTGDDVDPVDSYVSGMSVYAIVASGAITGIFEYVAADEFDAAELSWDSEGASPSAANLEVGYAIDDVSSIALGYQMTDEAVGMGLVEDAVLVSYSREIYDATTLSFEYMQGDYYSQDDDGSGLDKSAFTAQLAVEF